MTFVFMQKVAYELGYSGLQDEASMLIRFFNVSLVYALMIRGQTPADKHCKSQVLEVACEALNQIHKRKTQLNQEQVERLYHNKLLTFLF